MYDMNGEQVSIPEMITMFDQQHRLAQAEADRDTLYRAIRHALVDLQFVPHAIRHGNLDSALGLVEMVRYHLVGATVAPEYLQDGHCIHPDVFVQVDGPSSVHCHTCGQDILAEEL